MEAAVVCIPISEGQIERLKALYPVLKEEILSNKVTAGSPDSYKMTKKGTGIR